MKTLLLASLFISLNSFATTFIVEMKKPLTPSEISAAKKKGFGLELFDQTQTAYFKKTYRVEAANESAISSNFSVMTLESVHRAQYFSLEPKPNSAFLRPDALFHLQWGLHNQGQKIKKLINNTKEVSVEGKAGSDIRWADAIKKIEAGIKKEPLVAVVDMGIDLDHPEIKSRLFKNTIECDENGEIADSEEDKDKNGLKGDCMGWNFAARNMLEARRPYDDTGHGTHVAGIIAAEANNEGISGVSSRIKILPVKVTGTIDESSDRKGIQPLTDRIAKGILYATNMGADVINLSLGWTRSMDTKYLNEAIEYALSKNVIIVAAAGNNNNNASIFPCSHYDVICVGAATIDGTLAEFSNYGGEVDVLAPGDEIISIIPTQIVPLQLNLQGYDTRSGTSQATPFVSAAAALLRGNFPRMHRDEVTRRIVDSADAGVPGKSLSGMLNLKGAFEIAYLPSVRPTFKNFSVALYDGPTNKFLFPMKAKNFGPEVKDVVFKINSKSDSFKMSQEFTVPLIRTGEVITLRMEGDITDPTAHNQVRFEVTVVVPGSEPKSYEHEFRMARDILKDQNILSVPFEFVAGALPVGAFKDNQIRNLINTVESLTPEFGLPEYYLPRLVKETNSLDIKLLRPEDGKLKEVAGVFSLVGATQLLNVMRLDLNYDGVEDYLIRAVACDKNCEDPEKASRYIQYSLWKKDMTPLLGAKSVWKFLPIMFNVDIKSQRFLKIKTKEFGELALPAFLETGLIPLEQQVVAAFAKPDLSAARRVYYIEPVSNPEGVVELITRTISTTEFIKTVRTTLKVSPAEEIQALHLLNQTKEDLKTGRVNALLSIGKGYLRRNVLVTLGEQDLNLRPFSIAQNLWGYDLLNSFDLENQDLADSFTGLVSRSRLVMFQSAGKGYSYNSRETVEAPIATIASFIDQETEFTFFQTPSYLMLAKQSASGTELSRMKINRFSFLPGTLFNDSFYPVLTKSQGKFSPALYVDETDIQSNIVSFTVHDDGKLKSPIRQSAYIPPICKALNPVRLDSDEGHSFTLLCFENKQWLMKFVGQN
jgi:hypothetical protein